MRATRKARKMPQHELARLLGIKQATVSQIETGEIGASRYVPAIAVALEIAPPPPQEIDPEDARWIAAGREIRNKSDRRFKHLLEFLESEAHDRDN